MFFDESNIDLDAFRVLCAQEADSTQYPLASGIEKNVLLYDGNRVRAIIGDALREQRLMGEWNRCLSHGPGVLVIRGAYANLEVVDRTTALFMEIIADEKDAGKSDGDHFGANERIWNSLQKVCMRDPRLFVAYYGEPMLALISRAWLGPHYQVTAQVNNVKPGSASQSPHRDYHLGFQSDAVVAQFPAHIQQMSQYLTLQGAIAHTDMPIAAGPTLFLPFSQQYSPGYMAYRNPEFVAFFEQHHVQLPLQKGDAVYFNPALFHGAGTNTQSTDRLANLVQISSAFGRPMESIDRYAMIDRVYPVLAEQQENLGKRRLRDTIAAIADGYSFPTNLDSDPPVDGNAPQTAQDYVWQAVQESWPAEKLRHVLQEYRQRRKA